MAKRRHTRKFRKRRKRKFRRKKRSSGFLTTMGSGLVTSFPMGKRFKFRTRYFARQVDIDPGASGTPASHVFQLNSLFAPDITGTSHQPIGFDQMMLMFDHYTVIGARVRVSCFNNDLVIAQNIILQIKDSSTVSTNTPEIIENGLCRWTTLAPAGTGGSNKTLSINWSAAKFFGKKGIVTEHDFRGDVSSAPAEGAFLHIIVDPINVVNTDDVRCSVLIEFISILTEPKQLGQS